mmetsp:Transcript_47384/g.112673  ORF Transcript_47384/g.112673 Transcript_47384/m.112673 type:complete len:259 (+) Transcript_47384:585-1361(+)
MLPELISACDRTTFHNDLSLFTDVEERAVRVPIHDAHVGSGLHPHRAKFALPTSGVGGNGHGLCHGICGHHMNLQHFLHRSGHSRDQCGRTVSDELELVLRWLTLLFRDFLCKLKNLQMHSGNSRIPIRLWLRDQGCMKVLYLEDTRQAHHLRSCDRRSQDVNNQSMNVEKRHCVQANMLMLELNCRSYAHCTTGNVRVRQRHDFRLFRRTGGMQNQSKVITLHGCYWVAKCITLQGLPSCMLAQLEQAGHFLRRCQL